MLCLTLKRNDVAVIDHQYDFELLFSHKSHILVKYKGETHLALHNQTTRIDSQISIVYSKLNGTGAQIGFIAPRTISINRAKIERSKMEGSVCGRNNPVHNAGMETRPICGVPVPYSRSKRT